MKDILLHGLGQTGESWNRTREVMEQRADVLVPDLFQLLKDGEINYARLYEAFAKYCGDFTEPLNICGLSLGGILALQYGIENPDRVNSLVLIGTRYVMPKGLLKVQNIIFSVMPDSTFKKMGFEKKEFINLSKSMMDLNFQQDLHRISCPVLVLCGEKDSANKPASRQLQELIPQAKLLIIKNAGHEVNLEAPERLGEILNEFLKKEAHGSHESVPPSTF